MVDFHTTTLTPYPSLPITLTRQPQPSLKCFFRDEIHYNKEWHYYATTPNIFLPNLILLKLLYTPSKLFSHNFLVDSSCKPSICRITSFAFLLLEPTKNFCDVGAAVCIRWWDVVGRIIDTFSLLYNTVARRLISGWSLNLCEKRYS